MATHYTRQATARRPLQDTSVRHARSKGNCSKATTTTTRANVLHRVKCHTIVDIRTPEDVQLVMMANDLVSDTFYSPSANALVDVVSYNSYRMRAGAQTIAQHMGGGRSHATVVAFSEEQQQQCQHQQRQQYAQRQLTEGGRQQGQAWQHRGSHQQEQDERPLVGCVNVTIIQASSSISAAASCEPGTPFALVTNLAVVPKLRQQGIAHQLMQAAIRAAVLELDYSPSFALLLAYKYYEPAVRLYESWGFEATDWADPLWVEDAEKGKVGKERRIMMVKQLSGLRLTVDPLGGIISC